MPGRHPPAISDTDRIKIGFRLCLVLIPMVLFLHMVITSLTLASLADLADETAAIGLQAYRIRSGGFVQAQPQVRDPGLGRVLALAAFDIMEAT